MTFDEKEIRLCVGKVVEVLEKSNADFEDGLTILVNVMAQGMAGIVVPEDVDKFIEGFADGLKDAYEEIRKERLH